MAFKNFNESLDSLKPFLNENIYNGEFLRDIDFSILQEKYIKGLKNDSFDIVRNDNSILIGHPLKWDSGYFGFSCYRISYLNTQRGESVIPDIYDFLKIKKVKLAFLSLNTSDPLKFYLTQHPSFRLCSTKIMYRQNLEKSQFMAGDEEVYLEILANMPNLTRKKSEKRIKEVAPQLFKTNRFMADDRISKKKAIGVYQEWIKNSIKERPQDTYCLLNRAGELCAFSVIRDLNNFEKKLALLELIATLIKGKDYGRLILGRVASELKRKKKEIFYANADIRNYSAQNLFCQNGFTAYHSVDEYHCWVE